MIQKTIDPLLLESCEQVGITHIGIITDGNIQLRTIDEPRIQGNIDTYTYACLLMHACMHAYLMCVCVCVCVCMCVCMCVCVCVPDVTVDLVWRPRCYS